MESLLKQHGEARVEGLSMPQFHGRMGEFVELYFDQVVQYLQAKNIDYQDPDQNTRVLAVVVSNLKHNAHARYRINKYSITNVERLIEGPTREFVPPDLQEHLRDQLYSLHQRKCSSLEDYISRFSNAIMQPTKEEIQYRRCQTVSEAISAASEYDRSHSSYSGFRGRQINRHRQDTRSHYRPQQSYAPSHRFVPRQDFRRDNMLGPMKIDSGRVSAFRSAANKKTCAYCKKLGHSIDECFKKKNRDVRQKSARGISSTFRHNYNGTRDSVNYFEVEEKVEISGVDCNSLEVDEAQAAEDLSVVAERPENQLIHKNGLCEGKESPLCLTPVQRLTLCDPDWLLELLKRNSQVTRFDGSKTEPLKNKRDPVALEFESHMFLDVDVMEWQINKAHDVILGKPWFARFQPTINWRTHQTSFPKPKGIPQVNDILTSKEFAQKLKEYSFDEVYRVEISEISASGSTPPAIEKLLRDYDDAFPGTLPPGLPPTRRVEFELDMKADAIPSNRTPFRLSKTEQEALNKFVEERLQQGWIEVSNSPWVSNIFGIPKKDPKSGAQISRAD